MLWLIFIDGPTLKSCLLFVFSCSQKDICPAADVHPLRYVTNTSKCVKFASVKPEPVPLGPSVQVWILIIYV